MKSKIQFLLLCCLGSSILLFGQHEEEVEFAYANNSNGNSATYILKTHDYKYNVAKKVLDDLIVAKGNRRTKAPKFEMSNATRKVAFANLSRGVIGLEEKGYDICISFGGDSLNALAALLSHELIHYYDEHDWEGRQKQELEEEADYLGGFLAFTAGYNTLGIMPSFLEKTYQEYDFPEEMRGYPALSERQDVAIKSLKKLKKLIGVFETANYLAIIGDFENALLYYEYILQEEYKSREIYNNIGVIAVMAGIDLFNTNELKFAYPIELDAVSRLSFPPKGFGKGEEREVFFRQAAAYFDQAKDLDPEYPTAWLNLANAYTLLEEYFDAEFYVRKALQICQEQQNEKVLGDIYTLMGIIAAAQDNSTEAIENFEKGIQLNNDLAKINLEIINDTYKSDASLPGFPNNLESIQEVNLNMISNQLIMNDFEADEQIELNRSTYFFQQNHTSSKILINFLPFEDKETYSIFHITEPTYNGQTLKGIQIGDSKNKIQEVYGFPNKVVENTMGQFLIYTNKRIVFEMNDQGNVEKWIVFRYEEKQKN